MYKYLKLITYLIIFITFSELVWADNIDISSDKPVDIEADKIYYNKEAKVAYATGNVILTQESQTILADELTYYKDTQVIYAHNNVVLMKNDGNVFFADSVRLDRSKQEGVALNLKIRMAKNALLASKGAILHGESNVNLEEFVYSPCKVCQDNFISNIPVWQIRGEKAELDKKAERIYYKNAKIEAFGVPIFFTPYFSTPSPGAKRKSGFLTPKFFMNKELGFATRLPYYLNIAPNMDMTYSPTYLTKSGFLHEVEFRHRLKSGSYRLYTSLTKYKKVDPNGNLISGSKEFRGHYDFKGAFTIKKGFLNGFLDMQAKRARDKTHTYLKKYKISDEDVLRTDINYRQFHYNNYYSVRALSFQDLRPDVLAGTTAAALPLIENNYEHKTDFYNSSIYANLNAVNLTRSQGIAYQRLSVKPGWKAPIVLPYGQQASINASIRSDIYNVKQNRINPTQGKHGGEGRIYPELYTEWSWPWYNNFEQHFIILEPVVGVVLAPVIKDLKKPGNQDSQDPEISAVTLFSTNRFRGFDKIESGARVNYGIKGNIKASYFKNLNFLAGQVIRNHKDKNFLKGSGFEGKRSDYVSSINIQLDESINLGNRTRLNERNLELMRNETNFLLSKPRYNLALTYANISSKLLDPSVTQYKQELLAQAGYNLYKEFWLDGYVHTRLGKKVATSQTRLLSNGVSLKYKGDCLFIELGVVRDYINLKDLKPTTTPTISFLIPTF